MRKLIFIAVVLALSLIAAVEDSTKSYHHCSEVGGTGNSPHLFDTSEIYKCDEGKIEIMGRREMVIERGYVYQTEMGKPIGEPHRASDADFTNYKWCADPGPADRNQQRMCGDKPTTCYDGKPSTWDPEWQGHSCVTPDHK